MASSSSWKYPELPSPVTAEDFIAVAKEALEHRKQLVNDPGWESFQKNPDVSVDTLKVPGSNIEVVRASMILENVDIEAVFNCFYLAELDEKKKVDPNITDHRFVGKINDNVIITYSRYNTPFMVTNREFLVVRTFEKLENGGYVVAIQSVNIETEPFKHDVVRAFSNCATFLEPVDNNKVIITTMDHIEPKGWIPVPIVNSYKKKTADKLRKIQDVYRLRK